MPTMTGVVYYTFATGLHPGQVDLQGLRWLERPTSGARKYDRRAFRNFVGPKLKSMFEGEAAKHPTLFQLLGEQPSLGAFTLIETGLHRDLSCNALVPVAKYFLRRYRLVCQSILSRFHKALAERTPRFTWLTLPMLDWVAHLHGLGEEYEQYLGFLDTVVGELVDTLEAAVGRDNLLVALSSDHGCTTIDRHLDLRGFLERELGFSAYQGGLLRNLELPLPELGRLDHDLYVAINGNTMAHLYASRLPADVDPLEGLQQVRPLKGGRAVDLLAALRSQEGIELLLVKEKAGSIAVLSRNSAARISREKGVYRYALDPSLGRADAPDPLGLAVRFPNLLTGKEVALDRNTWLETTAELRYHDAVVQIADLLTTSRNAGDIVVLAAAGWDLSVGFEFATGGWRTFSYGEFRGGHGNLEVGHLGVPLLVRHPSLPTSLRSGVARVEDLVPTFAAFFGVVTPADLLGLPLLERAERGSAMTLRG